MPNRKALLRAQARSAVSAMHDAERVEASAQIRAAIEGTVAYARAKCILGYWPLPGEPDLLGLLEHAAGAGKRVCLPRVVGDAIEIVEVRTFGEDLRRSPLGVLEPLGGLVVPPADLDLLLVPGMAFDRRGGRIGRGKGFYDRVLTGRADGWMVCGVCYEAAVVEEAPMEAHDAPVDALATERGISPVLRDSAGVWRTASLDR